MLDSLVRVSRRDRQTTHALDCNQSSAKVINLTDSRYRQHATVTRPHIISTQLAKSFDRDKRLLVISTTTTAVGNQDSNHKGFAGTQHLNCQFSRMQPDDRNKCGASSVDQTAHGSQLPKEQQIVHHKPPTLSLNVPSQYLQVLPAYPREVSRTF